MRVGIVTFHASHNFGSALQAYAMQVAFLTFGAVLQNHALYSQLNALGFETEAILCP